MRAVTAMRNPAWYAPSHKCRTAGQTAGLCAWPARRACRTLLTNGNAQRMYIYRWQRRNVKRIRYYTVAAATAVVLACFVGPGIASASPTASEMCNTDQVGQGLCAQATGNKSNDYFKMEKKASSSLFTPTTRSGTAQMRLAGTNLCLTQDNGYAPN